MLFIDTFSLLFPEKRGKKKTMIITLLSYANSRAHHLAKWVTTNFMFGSIPNSSPILSFTRINCEKNLVYNPSIFFVFARKKREEKKGVSALSTLYEI